MGTFFSKAARKVNWLGVGVIVGVLALWQLVVSTRMLYYEALPDPSGIFSALKYLVNSGLLWPQLEHTLECALKAWVIAVAIGGLVGLLMGLSGTVAAWTTATVNVFRSLPVVVMIPIAILVWGPGTKAEVLLGAYAALWPMLVNTAAGVRGIPPRLRDVSSTLRLSRVASVRKIVVPFTGGAMLVGARLALTVALVICVVSEMLGLQAGIGNALVLEQSADQPARMWAYVLIVGALGIALNAALVTLVDVAFPGVSALTRRSVQ